MRAALLRLLTDVEARRLGALEAAEAAGTLAEYGGQALEAENAAYGALRAGIEDALRECLDEDGVVYIEVPLSGEPLERMRAMLAEWRAR